MKPPIKKNNDWLLNRLHAVNRVILCFALAVGSYFIIPLSSLNELSHIMLCWDIFAISMLILSWFTFFTTDHHHIREQAKDQDGSRVFIFLVIIICTFASLLAVIILLTSKTELKSKETLQLVIAIAAMIFSWALVHTNFTYRYAHIFYGEHERKKDTDARGLNFPEEPNPDLLDFAYFSFVLGMTFQVSDVNITSPRIRQLALFHGLISFTYNTAIIALTINVIAGLRK
jgi:uncharacterized membrane protein